MNFSLRRLLQLLLLTTTATVFTAAMICKKMIPDDSSDVNNGITNDIMEMGRYTVVTNRKVDSTIIKHLISKLDGLRDIQYRDSTFTAILLPRHLKKVIKHITKLVNQSHYTIYIK